MTDRIIELAKQAGAAKYVNRHYPDKASFGFTQEQLQRFAELVRNEAQQPAPVQEPIGWYWEYNGRPEGKVFFAKPPDQDVIERGLSAEFPCIVRYVYTSPQAQQPAPPADVPLLTGEELKDAIRHLYQDETALQMSIDITLHEFRAIEQAVHRKLGVVE